MDGYRRMSPLTALFLGLWIVGGIGIAGGTAITLYALRIIDGKVSDVFALAENTIGGLPELLETLPAAVRDVLGDRRAPEYADQIQVRVNFVEDRRRGGLRPALTITNTGNQVVSLLAVRVAALERGIPIGEWTEIAATPFAIGDEWRGLLMPGKTRYIVASSWRTIPADKAGDVLGVFEISELRVWDPDQPDIRTRMKAEAQNTPIVSPAAMASTAP